MERIKQVLAVWLLLYGFYLAPLFGILLFFYLLFYTPLWPLMLIYALWIFLDRKTASTTGRRREWMRNLRLWKHFRDYFPHKMVSTAPLPPAKNYLACFFPHGILATGAMAHFANDTSSAPKLFPGLNLGGFTLGSNFMVPFFRELALGYGLVAVSKESMLYSLGRGKGNLMCIYPGGAAEAAITTANSYRTVLNRRKGFIKIAILTGTSLVPCLVFGEPDIFDHWRPKEGTLLRKLQDRFRDLSGISLCFFTGRGVLQPWFGLMPHRVQVTTVVGPPLDVTKNENPTVDEINKVHKEFKEALWKLFEEQKHKYVANPEKTFITFEEL